MHSAFRLVMALILTLHCGDLSVLKAFDKSKCQKSYFAHLIQSC